MANTNSIAAAAATLYLVVDLASKSYAIYKQGKEFYDMYEIALPYLQKAKERISAISIEELCIKQVDIVGFTEKINIIEDYFTTH